MDNISIAIILDFDKVIHKYTHQNEYSLETFDENENPFLIKIYNFEESEILIKQGKNITNYAVKMFLKLV